MAIEAASFIVLEDGTRKKAAASADIFEGQALKINASGELEPAGKNDKVYGLSKLDSNAFRDFAFGEFGAFGSGQLTVVTRGILLIGQSVFNEVEVDTSTTTASAPTTVKLFDDAKTYAPGEPLYVSAAGLITNDGAGGKESLLGKVLKTPLQTGGFLEIEVDPGTTSVAAELA
jgi:hypothetical protein